MGNIFTTLKKFFTNKNTVTILGIIAGVIVLWAFYNYRVNQAVNPIQVPYAKEAIGATEQITSDKIGFVEINRKFLNTASVVTSSAQLIGKYVTTGTSIPVGGLFYTTQVVKKDDLPNTVFENIPKGYTIFSLGVDNHTTYANSIYPGDRIDLYVKTRDELSKVMFGKFIESIEVLAVRDSSGKNVFDSSVTGTPAELLFAVPDDMYSLLMKAQALNITLLPVPRNKNYTSEGGDTKINSEQIKNFILSQSASIADAE